MKSVEVKELFVNADGYCNVRDWCENQGFDYSETMRILRKNNFEFATFGSTKMALKVKLDETRAVIVNRSKENLKNKSENLKLKAKTKRENNAFVEELQNSHGWSKNDIIPLLMAVNKDKEKTFEFLKSIDEENAKKLFVTLKKK